MEDLNKKYLTELEQRRLLVENLTEIEFNELESLIEMHVNHVDGNKFLKKIPWFNLTDCRCGPEILGPNVEQRMNKLIQKTGRLN